MRDDECGEDIKDKDREDDKEDDNKDNEKEEKAKTLAREKEITHLSSNTSSNTHQKESPEREVPKKVKIDQQAIQTQRNKSTSSSSPTNRVSRRAS